MRARNPAKLWRKPPTEAEREAVREGVGAWYLVAKGLIDQLYHMTDRMYREVQELNSPLAEFLTVQEIGRLAGTLERASCEIADIVPVTGLDVPDPVAVIRGLR